IADPLGEFLANSLVDSVFAKGLVARMDQAADGTSYLQAAVTDAVANARAHWLRENADALQAQAAQARDDAGRTRGEAEADRKALAAVDDQLRAAPGSEDLQAEKQRLQAEIARRETEQKAADEAGADADRRIAENQDRLDQADRERKEAARRRAERHSETYPAER
ncbi:MAG TPA: hypothetical protein VK358_01645, partial [Longimicrobium sp.]|nr:hypothetical protein [Longimicrobium sp.]